MTKSIKTDTPNTDEAIKTVAETAEDKKADAQKALKLKNQKEMKAAKSTVSKFLASDESKNLSDEMRAAITRICGKQRSGSTGVDSIVGTLKTMFKKVGDKVDELAIFKATKMGRGEIRKKVRETLKKAMPEDRFWLEFDEKSESWVWLATGEKQPKGWLGKSID